MSNLVHCDGPGCDAMRNADLVERRSCEAPWLHVDEPPVELDFHSRECLIRWAGGVPAAEVQVRTVYREGQGPDPRLSPRS